ncbi:unnamed protein product [Rhizophagus irregularis]|nr:unnamed protein product [Rhizophagus irregularis]
MSQYTGEENMNLYTEDVNLYAEEDMHLQTEEDINDESYDTERVNFNEDDNEYYSDYSDDDNNEENNNNDDDNKENDDDDDDDENDDDENDDDDDDDDDDAMNVDDKTIIPKKIVEGLKLLHLKSLYNFTESAFDDIMKVFTTNNVSLYKVKKYLKEETGLVPIFYNMCENSCICYIGQYESYQNCPTD